MSVVRAVRPRPVPILVAALSAAVLVASGAAAVDPAAGPTIGGTVVTGTVPDGMTFTEVAAGQYHATGVGTDDAVYGWGYNGTGQLGDGTDSNSSVPVQVVAPEGVRFTDLDAGDLHTIALGSDGNTYAWGENAVGQLGDGGFVDSWLPVLVQTPPGVQFTDIAAGGYHNLALGSDGNTYAWGYNQSGQLGDGTSDLPTVPVMVEAPAGVTFTAVDAGTYFSVALGSDGNTYAWGANTSGQLGNPTAPAWSELPVQVETPAGVTFTGLSAGADHVLAAGSDTNTYAWGSNSDGQLGDGTTTGSSSPVQVDLPAGVTFAALAAGGQHSLALGTDGQAYAWGNNTYGQLGDGTTTASTLPVTVLAPAGAAFTAIASGHFFSLALRADAQAYAWGYNGEGELGDGTTTTSPVPVRVAPGATVESVTFGTVPGTDLSQDGPVWSATTPAGLCGVVDVTVTYSQLGVVTTQIIPDGFTFGTVPVVTDSPESVTLPAGTQDATFTASASGDDVPSVQWQQATPGTEDWTDLPGATSTTLVLAVTADADVRAVFTNCLSTATTETASVRLSPTTPPPSPSPSVTTPGETTPPGEAAPSGTTAPPTATAPGGGLAETGVDGLLPALCLAASLTFGGLLLRARRQRTAG